MLGGEPNIGVADGPGPLTGVAAQRQTRLKRAGETVERGGPLQRPAS